MVKTFAAVFLAIGLLATKEQTERYKIKTFIIVSG